MALELEFTCALDGFLLQPRLQTQARRIALLGPSGAGKSLTLQAIAGLLRPDQGVIRVDGDAWFDHARGIDRPTQDRRVAYLFQDYALFPHLTAGQNIAFGLRQGWLNPGRRQPLPPEAMRWVRAFGLEALLERYPDTLSGGQRQRVALARALSIQPRLLLLDEPLAALDTDLRRQLRIELAQLLQGLDIPMVLVTHDVADVQALAETAFRIAQGRIVA